MKLTYCYTVQGVDDVNFTLGTIKRGRIPLADCRFFCCDDDTMLYMQSVIRNKQIILQSAGLSKELDHPLNVMRLAKNRADRIIVGLSHGSTVTMIDDMVSDILQFQSSLVNKLSVFSTNYLYPCKKHVPNEIDSRIMFCNAVRKEMLDSYIDTCESMNGIENADRILENMQVRDYITVDFSGMKSRTEFQMFLLQHFSEYKKNI